MHADPPGHPFRPASSEKEQPVFNGKVAGSSPARGSTTYQYIIVRKELSGGALLSMVAHAAGESAHHPLPADTRVVVLSATKEQMERIREWLQVGHASVLGVAAILETDGPLTGSYPSIGIVTSDRDALRAALPLLAELKPWRRE